MSPLDISTLEMIKLVGDLLILPVLGMVWSIQGRMSRMEGEIKALYEIVKMLAKGHE